MNLKDERTWATFVHLGGLLGTWFWAPVGNVIAPLVLWLIKRNESAFVDDQGREAVNFQITISILSILLRVLGWILAQSFHLIHSTIFWAWNDGDGAWFPFWSGWSIFYGLPSIAWVLSVVCSIIAATRANNGIAYRYPLSLRLVK